MTLMPPAADNPAGFWESARIAALNDDLLAAAGTSWAEWTHVDLTRMDPSRRTRLESRMMDVLQDEFGAAELIVLKDPRISRLLPLWLPVLARAGFSVQVLLTIRPAARVAESLARRNGFPATYSVLLWLRHVLDAELNTRGLPRACVSFNELLSDWRAALMRAEALLGIAWPRGAYEVTEPFLAPRLPEADAPPTTGSAYAEVWCQHAWRGLRALETGTPGGIEVLDRVRSQFDDACRLFAPPRPRPARRPRAAMRDVTLCAADSTRVALTARALERSAEQCELGSVLLFSDRVTGTSVPRRTIAPLSSMDDYSTFVLRHLLEHLSTTYALVVQWDGFVVAPEMWDPAFLDYDYVGARWAGRPEGQNVGNGGFSLRSRRLLEALQLPKFNPVPGVPEDELIGSRWRRELECMHGIRFAPAALADRFAYERILPRSATFGFHGLFNLWRHLDDAEITTTATLLPAEVVHRREFAELTALCFLQARPDALRSLVARWKSDAPSGVIRAALSRLVPSHRHDECWDAGKLA